LGGAGEVGKWEARGKKPTSKKGSTEFVGKRGFQRERGCAGERVGDGMEKKGGSGKIWGGEMKIV